MERSSRSEPRALRIEHRLEPDDCGAYVAENVDLEAFAVAGEGRGDIAGGDALADAVAEGTGSDVTDGLAVFHDGFVADDFGVGVLHFHHDEAPLRAGGAFGEHGVAASEIRLVEIDEAIEAGFSRGVIRPEVLVERAVRLL